MTNACTPEEHIASVMARVARDANNDDEAFSAVAQMLRQYETRLRERYAPCEPGNPTEAITRVDEHGATWTLKWQALYQGGIGQERNATAESLAAIGFVRDPT
jgi:hypothetical protein